MKNFSIYTILLTLLVLTGGGCENSSFTGQSGTRGGSSGGGEPGNPVSTESDDYCETGAACPGMDDYDGAGDSVNPGETLEDVGITPEDIGIITGLDEEARAKSLLKKSFSSGKKDSFWVVTRPNSVASTGQVYYFELVDDELVKNANGDPWKKRWKFSHYGHGARTYVTEGGLMFTQENGRFYFVDPEGTPEEANLTNLGGINYRKVSGPGTSERSCLVSYKRDGKRWAGFAYGNGKFGELELSATAPYAPQWSTLKIASLSGNSGSKWGYSCFIDQERMYFYSQWSKTQGAGVKLNTLTTASRNSLAPNANFSNNAMGSGGGNTRSGYASYAMAGDASGNILNGRDFYTFANDPLSKMTFGTKKDQHQLYVYPEKCLASDATCTSADIKVVKTDGVANKPLGPMSPLRSGGIIGLTRSDTYGQIFLIKWDGTSADLTKLGRISGDPYMYNDFTGATLYVEKGELDYDLKDNQTFDDEKALKILSFTWEAKEGHESTWDGLTLKIRCFAEGSPQPAWSTVKSVRDAGELTFITAGSCRNKDVNHAEVEIIPDDPDSTAIYRVGNVSINFYQ